MKQVKSVLLRGEIWSLLSQLKDVIIKTITGEKASKLTWQTTGCSTRYLQWKCETLALHSGFRMKKERQRMSGVVPSVSWKCNSSQEMQIHIIIIKTSKGTSGFLKQCLQCSPSGIHGIHQFTKRRHSTPELIKNNLKKKCSFWKFHNKKMREILIERSGMINNHCVHLSLSRYHHMLHGNYRQSHFLTLNGDFRLLSLQVHIIPGRRI